MIFLKYQTCNIMLVYFSLNAKMQIINGIWKVKTVGIMVKTHKKSLEGNLTPSRDNIGM